jgi:hypothetical protein
MSQQLRVDMQVLVNLVDAFVADLMWSILNNRLIAQQRISRVNLLNIDRRIWQEPRLVKVSVQSKILCSKHFPRGIKRRCHYQ